MDTLAKRPIEGRAWIINSIRGIGVEAAATRIGILASSISVRYYSIPVLDCGTLIPVMVQRSSVGFSIAQLG